MAGILSEIAQSISGGKLNKAVLQPDAVKMAQTAVMRDVGSNIDNLMYALEKEGGSFADTARKDILDYANNAATESIDDIANKVVSLSNLGQDKAMTETAEKAINAFKESGSKFTKYASEGRTLAGASEYFGREAGTGIGLGNTAKGYFLDAEHGSIRRKAAIGGVAAGAVGVRYLSGGNLTTDAQGNKDIAGIPFI